MEVGNRMEASKSQRSARAKAYVKVLRENNEARIRIGVVTETIRAEKETSNRRIHSPLTIEERVLLRSVGY